MSSPYTYDSGFRQRLWTDRILGSPFCLFPFKYLPSLSSLSKFPWFQGQKRLFIYFFHQCQPLLPHCPAYCASCIWSQLKAANMGLFTSEHELFIIFYLLLFTKHDITQALPEWHLPIFKFNR